MGNGTLYIQEKNRTIQQYLKTLEKDQEVVI